MERCAACKLPFDGSCRPPLTGECGHAACSGCWARRTHCPTCNRAVAQSELTTSYPLSARDLTSPEPMDSMDAESVASSSASAGAAGRGEGRGSGGGRGGDTKEGTAASQSEVTVDYSHFRGPGPNSEVVVEVDPNMDKTSVGGLKKSVETKKGISAQRQTLLHMGKPMSSDTAPLSAYRVTNGSRIQMMDSQQCYGG